MGYKIPLPQLKELYRIVLEDGPELNPGAGVRMMQEIARQGWAHSWLVEDLLMISDRRLSSYKTSIDLVELSRPLKLPLRDICVRPGARSSNASLNEAWEAVDAAALFIVLEMLSFAIDPTPIVAAVRSSIPKKGYISNAALDVLWYEKRKGKGRITFEREDTIGPLSGHKQHVLRGGYKLIAMLDLEGEPVTLTFTGPRFREAREPVQTKCVECGITWYRGDPDSSADHRKTHGKRMAVLAPQPSERVLAEMAAGDFSEHVDWMSPEWRHREMTTRASAFKREEGYDFTQWDMPETDPDAHGFMFTNPDGTIVGACAFRLRKDVSGADRWGLQFVWVAPPHRRSGVLRSRWPALRERFGDFDIEAPVSDAMTAFATSMGDGHLL